MLLDCRKTELDVRSFGPACFVGLPFEEATLILVSWATQSVSLVVNRVHHVHRLLLLFPPELRRESRPEQESSSIAQPN